MSAIGTCFDSHMGPNIFHSFHMWKIQFTTIIFFSISSFKKNKQISTALFNIIMKYLFQRALQFEQNTTPSILWLLIRIRKNLLTVKKTDECFLKQTEVADVQYGELIVILSKKSTLYNIKLTVNIGFQANSQVLFSHVEYNGQYHYNVLFGNDSPEPVCTPDTQPPPPFPACCVSQLTSLPGSCCHGGTNSLGFPDESERPMLPGNSVM